jgi:predicted ATPase
LLPAGAGNTPQLVPVLHGLWTYHVVRAQHTDALALGMQVLELGVAARDDGLLLQGNLEVGWSKLFLGELQQAREHLERSLELYDHERHSSHALVYGNDPATAARGCLAQVLWLLGHVEEALRYSEENISVVRSRVEHVHTVAYDLDVAAFLRQYMGDAVTTRALADEALAWSEKHSLAFLGAMATILKGWALTQAGELQHGVEQMRRGLATQLATGAEFLRPYWLCLIAEICRRTGAAQDGLALLDEAEAIAEHTQERYWEAEIHRVRGHLLLAVVDPRAGRGHRSAEECYLRALEVARRQDARSLELRATTSLSRLWQAEGRESEACDLLVPVYESFPAGLDTPDLREAAALLADLGAGLAISAT